MVSNSMRSQFLIGVVLGLLLIGCASAGTCTSGTGAVYSPAFTQANTTNPPSYPAGAILISSCTITNGTTTTCPAPSTCASAGQVGSTSVCDPSTPTNITWSCVNNAVPGWSRPPPAVCGTGLQTCNSPLGLIVTLNGNAVVSGGCSSLSLCPPKVCCNFAVDMGAMVQCTTGALWGCIAGAEAPKFRQLCNTYCGGSLGTINGVQCSGNCPALGCCDDPSMVGKQQYCLTGGGAKMTFNCTNPGTTPTFNPIPINPSCPLIFNVDQNVAYPQTGYNIRFSASGGTPLVSGGYSWTFTAAPSGLPPGMSLASTGDITGTPTQNGTFYFTGTATDRATGQATTSICNITVNPPLQAVCPSNTVSEVGLTYTGAFSTAGGKQGGQMTWTPISMPANGFTLSTGGTLTVTSSVSFTLQNVTVKVTDVAFGTASVSCFITFNPAPVLACPNGGNPMRVNVGQAAGPWQYAASLGSGTYTSYIKNPATGWPATGVTLSNTGALSVNPATVPTGSYTLCASVVDSLTVTSAAACCPLVVAPLPTITCPATPFKAVRTLPFSFTVAAVGGNGALTYASLTSPLPTGLTFASTGAGAVFSAAAGALTATQSAATVCVSVTDSAGFSATTTTCCSITINNPPTVGCPGVTFADIGTTYSQTIPVSGGTPTNTVSFLGTASAGLSISGTTISGLISGATGSRSYSLLVTDGGGYTASAGPCPLVVAAAPVLSCPTAGAAALGLSYSGTYTSTGGSGTLTYATFSTGITPLTGGTLGSSNGAVAGTAPATGTSFVLCVQLTDQAGVTVNATGPRSNANGCCTVTLAAPPTLACAAGPYSYGAGQAQSITFTSTGTGLTFATSTASPLPTGLALPASTSATITGSIATAGAYTACVVATDAATKTASACCAITVTNALALTCPSPAQPWIGALGATVFPQPVFAATGGTGAKTYSLLNYTGNGLTFSGATLTGQPTVATTTVAVCFQVTDAASIAATASTCCSINVKAKPSISCPASIVVSIGNTKSVTFPTPTQGSGTYSTFSFSQIGSLTNTPAFPFTSTAGVVAALSGTVAGTSSLVAFVTDSNNVASNTVTCPVTVNAGPTLSCTGGKSSNTNIAVSFPFTGTGTGLTYSTVSAQPLPTGLSLTGSTVSGTVTTSGTYTVCIRSIDAAAVTTSACCGLTVSAALVPSCPSPGSWSGEVGATTPLFPSINFAVTSGSGSKTYTLTSPLSAGLTIGSTSGVLTGQPTTAVTTNICVTVADQVTSSSTCCPLTVKGRPVLTCPASLFVAMGQTSTFSFAGLASSGSGTYSTLSFTTLGSLTPASGSSAWSSITNIGATATGTSSIVVTVTDSVGSPSAPVTCPVTVRLPVAFQACPGAKSVSVGQTVSFTFALTAGTGAGTVTYSTVAAPTLPASLTIPSNTSPVVSGTVNAAAGTYSACIKATDQALATASQCCLLTVFNPPTMVCPATPPYNGQAGVLFTNVNYAVTGTNLAPGITFAVTGGQALPAGLTLNSTTGVVSGTPSGPAFSASVCVTATDSLGGSSGPVCCLYVITVLQILCPNNLCLDKGVAFPAGSAFTATGGKTAYTFMVVQPPNNPAFTVASNGSVSGSLNTVTNTASVCAKVTDANTMTASRCCQINVVTPLTLSCPTQSVAHASQAYSGTLTAQNGCPQGGNFKFTATPTLPPGVTLTGNGTLWQPTGPLTGTVAATASVGPYCYTASAADVVNLVATASCCIQVIAPLAINCPPSPAGTILISRNLLYTGQVTITGDAGAAPPGSTGVWSVQPGSFPFGTSSTAAKLTFTGTFSAQTSTATIGTLYVSYQDITGLIVAAQCPWMVFSAPVIRCPTSWVGSVGGAMNQCGFSANNGAGFTNSPFTWTIGTIAASPQLAFTSSSTASVQVCATGKPTATFSGSVTVTVTDAAGATASKACPLTVNNLFGAPCPGNLLWTRNTPSTLVFQAVGGAPKYTYSFDTAACAKPTGFSISPTTSTSFSATVSGTVTSTVTSVALCLKVQDTTGLTAPITCTITVANPPVFGACPAGMVAGIGRTTFVTPNAAAVDFSTILTGGSGVISYSASPVPAGLTFTGSSLGIAVGGPTATFSNNVCVTATDGAATPVSVQKCCPLTILSRPAVNCNGNAFGDVGLPMTATFGATGGSGTYTNFAFATNTSLFSAQSASSTTGTFSASVASSVVAPGTYPIQVTVTDSNGVTGSSNCNVIVAAPPTISCPTASNALTANAGVAYSFSFSATGNPGFTFATLSTNPLPTPLTLTNANTGTIGSVAPSAANTYSVCLKVTDAALATASRCCTLTVVAKLALTCPATPPYIGEIGGSIFPTPLNFVATTAGGVGAKTYTASGLLTGQTFNAGTLTTGTLTTVTTGASICVTVTDSSAVPFSVSTCCAANVLARPAVVCPSPAIFAVKGVALMPVTFTVTGGSGTNTFTFTPTTGLFSTSTGTSSTGVFNAVTAASPPASGNSVAVSVVDSNGVTSLTANCPVTVSNPPTLACPANLNADSGVAISPITFAAVGGGPFTYSSTGMPTGLTLSTGGVVSGTYTLPGTVSQTVSLCVTATDAAGQSVSASPCCTLNVFLKPVISCPAPRVFSSGLPYTGTVSVVGGLGPFAYAVGTPNAAFSIGSTTGVVTRAAQTVTASTTLSTVFSVSDSLTGSSSVSCIYTIYPKPVPACPTLNVGVVGRAYTGSVTVNPTGLLPLTYSFGPSPAAPAGLSISGAGVVSFTSTSSGTFFYQLVVTDGVGTSASPASGPCPITIMPPLAATCPTAPSSLNVDAGQSVAYAGTVSVAGGVSPYTFAATGGPAGLTVGASTGAYSGAVSATTPANTYTVSITVSDSITPLPLNTVTITCPLVVWPKLTVLCPPTVNGFVGLPFSSGAASTTGGAGGTFAGRTYSVLAGSITPAGSSPAFTLTGASGTVLGTPSTVGTSTYTLQVTDGLGNTASTTTACTVSVTSIPIVDCPPVSPILMDRGVAYSSAYPKVRAGSGSGVFTTYTATGNPTGTFTFGASGYSGTPTATGSFTVTASVTDSAGGVGTTSCPIVVTIPPSIACPTAFTGEATVTLSFATSTLFPGAAGGVYSATGLPSSMLISGTTGQISGSAPATTTTVTYTVAITLTDGIGQTSTVSCPLVITPGPWIQCPTVLNAVVTVLYSQIIPVGGGSGSYSIVSVPTAPLPPGLNIVGGNLTGAPSLLGTQTFGLRVIDSAGGSAQVSCDITAASPGCLSAAPAVAGLFNGTSGCSGCASCERTANPCFSKQCDLNTVLILDNSLSIAGNGIVGSPGNYIPSVRSGVYSFLDGVQNIVNVGGTARLGVIYFSNVAFDTGFGLQPVTSAYITSIKAYLDVKYLNTGDGNMQNTNWADALKMARGGYNSSIFGNQQVDVFVMFTDGNPQDVYGPWVCNAQCYSFSNAFFGDVCTPPPPATTPVPYCPGNVAPGNPTGAGVNFPSTLGNEEAGLYAACYAADAIKKSGSKIFLVGVGNVYTNEDEIEVITGKIRWDGDPATFFTSDYIINTDYAQLQALFQLIVNGLCPCLTSAPPCSPNGVGSCNAQLFTARVRVTTRNVVPTTFPPFSVTAANIYYKYIGGSGTRVGWEFFTPGLSVDASLAATSIVRTDIVNPCTVERQVVCTNGCQLVQEHQVMPRFFLESYDTPGIGGALHQAPITSATGNCVGYTKNYPTPPFPVNLAVNSPEVIHYIWVLASDLTTPCAAEAYDGTFYEFFLTNGVDRGVYNLGITPNQLCPSGTCLAQPSSSVLFDFRPTANCSSPACGRAVEQVFVIDDQSMVPSADFDAIKAYVQTLVNKASLASPTSYFGIYYACSGVSLTFPTLRSTITDQWKLSFLGSLVVKGTCQANFSQAVTNAVNQYWSGTTFGLPRQLVTIVAGSDFGGTNTARWTALNTLFNTKNVEHWAIGVNLGAADTTLLGNLASTVGYVHYQAFQSTTQLTQINAVSSFARLICPVGNVCGDLCTGFCTCFNVPGNPSACACPTCASDACTVPGTRVCDPNTKGCGAGTAVDCSPSPPNLCNAYPCDPFGVGCLITPVVSCTNPDNCTLSACVPSSGTCAPTPKCPSDNNKCTDDACTPAGACTYTPIDVPARCDDFNACTVDACSPSAGCTHTSRTDCGGPNKCLNYGCDPATGCNSSAVNCDLGNKCVQYGCSSSSGCFNNPITCDDSNACTVDTCNTATGCVFTPLTAAALDDMDKCTTDACDTVIGITHTPITCDDKNPCTSDKCLASTGCVYTDISSSCNDNNACTADSCDSVLGCQYAPITCNDSSKCTTDSCDVLLGCQFKTITCNDSNDCTTDGCNAATGCTYTPITCDDSNKCTNDSCQTTGGCLYTPVTCDDNDVCTSNQCSPTSGCFFTPLAPCDDSNKCTTDTCDKTLGCQFTPINVPVVCNDNSKCTTDSCNPVQGCVYTPISCDDGLLCTVDTCSAATGCVYTPAVCDDNDPCTADSCDVATGQCVYDDAGVTCNDGSVCTTDTCVPFVGCVYTPIVPIDSVCDDHNPCTTNGCSTNCVFTPISGCNVCGSAPCTLSPNLCEDQFCVENKALCPDAQCNDTIDNAAANSLPPRYCYLAPKPANSCSKNSQCSTETCNPIFGCLSTPRAPCDDGNFCTTDGCDSKVGCQYTPITCSDGNVCTLDQCNPASGCVFPPVTCNDGNACTADVCDNTKGGCQYTPITCTPPTACLVQSCDTSLGCVYTPRAPCDDSNLCTTDKCDPVLGCVYTPISCDDKSVCTQDTCAPSTGCVYTPIPCTTDMCNTVVCDSKNGCVTTPITCNDSNDCTTDTCQPSLGCQYTPIVCDDKSACTKDTCATVGGCKYTNQCVDDPSNKCIAAQCDVLTGCSFKSIVCNNGDKCLQQGLCSPATGCDFTQPLVCNDNNAATDDKCVPGTGCVYTPKPCPYLPATCQFSINNGTVDAAGNCIYNNQCVDTPCDVSHCNNGACSFTPRVCADADKCNLGVCNPSTGCATVKKSCVPPNPCQELVRCDPLVGCIFQPIVDPSGQSCTVCDTATGVFSNKCIVRDACQNFTCVNNQCVFQERQYADVDPKPPVDLCHTFACVIVNGSRTWASTPVVCNDGSSCTTDVCKPAQGCVYPPIPCPPGANACTEAFACDGTGATPVCQYRHIFGSWNDLCDTCTLDNPNGSDWSSCFFSSIIPTSTVAGISAGVAVGIAAAVCIAVAIGIWLSKKGYDFYKAKSEMNAANLMNNPYYANNNMEGNMVDLGTMRGTPTGGGHH